MCEAKNGLVFSRQRRVFQIAHRTPNKFFVVVQMSCNSGVSLHAELALVERRSAGGDQLAQGDADGRIFMHDFLREANKMVGGLRPECEQVPDMPIFRTG